MTKHRDFLVRYSQMLRARSDLFRQEVLKQYSDFEMQGNARRDALFKNMSITKMRTEIGKGAGEFAGWHWHLRSTEDVTKPVITGDNAVALIGSGHPSREEAMKYQDTLFVFPICWQACLIGSRQEFDETDIIQPTTLAPFTSYTSTKPRAGLRTHRSG